jgi:hypothetical protein
MRWLRRAIGGANALARSERAERDLDEELRACLEAAVEEKMRHGQDRDQATRAARLELGLVSIESVKDRVRDVGWEMHVERIWQDVRYALRTLRKSLAFATTAVLTLALGIGATTAIFSLLDAVILRSLPVSKPEELVLVVGGSQYPVFQAFRQHTDVFADLLATSGVTPLDVEIDAGARDRTKVSYPVKEPGRRPCGARLGYVGGQSEVSQVRWITDACSISATRRSRPPQRGHVSTSTPNVRRINSAH